MVDDPCTSESPSDGSEVVDLDYFTDPLCPWCWAFEPQWRRFVAEHRGLIRWRYRLAAMVQSWDRYADPLNSISRPSQIGPLCYVVTRATGIPIDSSIWHEDPPKSSLPACLAVAASRQLGADVAEDYLLRIRSALMEQGRNIGSYTVLAEVLDELREHWTGTPRDFDSFPQRLTAPETANSLRDDIKESRFRGIGRFPSLILSRSDGVALSVKGYRTADQLCEAMQALLGR